MTVHSLALQKQDMVVPCDWCSVEVMAVKVPKRRELTPPGVADAMSACLMFSISRSRASRHP